jgi:hypothetical protein
MNKYLDNAIFVMMVGILITVIIVIGIMVYPFKVVEFHSPYTVITKVVKAGQNLRYTRKAEKFMDGEASMGCSFQNEIVYSLPFKMVNNQTGNYTGSVEILVPENLPPSTYTYRCVLTYKLFGIREMRYEFNTDNFQVIK